MDDLERILAGDDAIAPSSGFADAVQAAVANASDEQAFRFPWGRWALGVAAGTVLAAAGAAALGPALPAARLVLQPLASIGPLLAYGAIAVAASIAVSQLPRWLSRS